FFFSRRRRHTRSKRDWSSDVCSSDLMVRDLQRGPRRGNRSIRAAPRHTRRSGIRSFALSILLAGVWAVEPERGPVEWAVGPMKRSEERRVGKGVGRCGGGGSSERSGG